MDALLPTLIIFLSLVGLILIFLNKPSAKKQKLVNEDFKKERIKFLGWFKQIKEVPSKEIFLNFWEKTLRRSRIIILRIDTTIADKLAKIKKGKFLEDKKNQDLKPIASDNLKEKDLIFEGLDDFDFNNLDLKEEEIKLLKLLKDLKENLESLEPLKNLARLYLWEGDYNSACWALLQVYYFKRDDKIIYDLFLEIKEKNKATEISKPM